MEEDDMDFTPTQNTSSKLASLFGINKPQSGGNSSLIYTAPKQPKKEASPSKTQSIDEKVPGKLEIILTKAVQAFKLENGTYVSQGTLGITVVGSHVSNVYQILLYGANKQHISKTKITRLFTFTVSDNNYASFYDSVAQNWSVRFTTPADIQQFARQVVIAKCNCSTEILGDILIQDLTAVVPPTAGYNHSLTVTYTCSLIADDKTTLLSDKSNSIIVLTEKEGVPWFKGLLGCSRSSKRVIAVPYSLSAPWTSDILPNANLLVEVDIESIDFKDSTENVALPRKPKVNDDSGESPVESSAEESGIKARGTTLKEALSSSKSHKANLISRMAKMGQATLPLKGALPCAPSDSEEESSVSSSPKPRMPRNRSTPSSGFSNTQHVTVPQDQGLVGQSVAVYQSDMPWQQPPQLLRSGVTYQQLVPVSASPLTSPTSDATMSVYLSESRTQAAELRMGMSKVSDKVDQVLNKLSELNFSSVDRFKASQPNLMDPTGVLNSIQSLVTENQSLKSKVEEQKLKLEQQNDRIYHLLELNSKYMEQNSSTQGKQSERETQLQSQVVSYIEKENQLQLSVNNSQERIKALEEEAKSGIEYKNKLQEENMMLKSKMDQCQTDREILEKKLEESFAKIACLEGQDSRENINEKMSEMSALNKSLEASVVEQKSMIDTRNSTIKALTIENSEMRNQIESLETKNIHLENDIRSIADDSKIENRVKELSRLVKQLEAEKEDLAAKVKRPSHSVQPGVDVVEEVKKVMNVVYRTLQPQFENGIDYSGTNIKEILASTIRDVTLSYLERTWDQKQLPTEPAKERGSSSFLNSKLEAKETANNPEVNRHDRRAQETQDDTLETKDHLKDFEVTETTEDRLENKDTGNGDRSIEKEAVEIKLKNNTAVDDQSKSYDQSWRPTKPPPPPLFDDEDDDDDWLS